MSVREPVEAALIDYPASDGEPVAETDLHIQLMMDLRGTFQQFFRNEPDVYIATNLFVYYEEGKPAKRVAPDFFFVRGVAKRRRRVYKTWEEGRVPDLVIEFSSRQTWREDIDVKMPLYQRLGIKEYFMFDPEYDYLIDTLMGFRLENGEYEPIGIKGGRVLSEVLGLELVDTGETLRISDPTTGRFLLTPEEEAEARARAEAEVARLQAEIERLKQGGAPE